MRLRLARLIDPSRMSREICPRIGTASAAAAVSCFLVLALNARALMLRHSSVWPSPDHSQVGRASAQCPSTRRPVGELIQ